MGACPRLARFSGWGQARAEPAAEPFVFAQGFALAEPGQILKTTHRHGIEGCLTLPSGDVTMKGMGLALSHAEC
jgi:hypothetical protein